MDDNTNDEDEDESMDYEDEQPPSPSPPPRRVKGRSSSMYPLKNDHKTPKKTQVVLEMSSPEVEDSCKKPPR